MMEGEKIWSHWKSIFEVEASFSSQNVNFPFIWSDFWSFSFSFSFSLFFDHIWGENFEIIEAQVLKLLHKKINLGGEHVHLFMLVNLAGAGLSALLISALVRSDLLNKFMSFLNIESEERTSSSNIYMLLGWAKQPMIEALDDEPLLHAVMGACRDIILQTFPCLGDCLMSHPILRPNQMLKDLVTYV
jgi:hypothetical protein